MTYTVSVETLNPTHSLSVTLQLLLQLFAIAQQLLLQINFACNTLPLVTG